MAGDFVQAKPPEEIPRSQCIVCTDPNSTSSSETSAGVNSAQVSKEDVAEMSARWENEVERATQYAIDSLLSASTEDVSMQMRRSNKKKLIISTMTPLTDDFFFSPSNKFDYMPIVGPGSSDALIEAARYLEHNASIRAHLIGHAARNTANAPETDVLEIEQEVILGLTNCVLQSVNEKDSIIWAKYPSLNFDILSVEDAFTALNSLGQFAPRRVCQHPFRKNDIVWVCRTCQADETCVLCHACWSDSDHVGHDFSFYHAQAGGCCDCGDGDAWDPRGFCSRHGNTSNGTTGIPDYRGEIKGLPWSLVAHARGAVGACLDWLVEKIADEASQSFVKMESEGVSMHGFRKALSIDDDCISTNSSNGSSSSESTTHYEAQAKQSFEYLLGERGRTGNGLFLVMHGSDVLSTSVLMNALKKLYSSQQVGFMRSNNAGMDSSSTISNPVVKKIVQIAQLNGDVVLVGTNEILSSVGSSASITSQLWKDGDEMTLQRIGSVMSNWAKILASAKIPCSIKTLEQLRNEQKAYAVLEWLGQIARCDALCEQISLAASQERHLVPMLKSDLRLPRRISKAYHSLQLTLLAVPDFKKQLANVYCDTYEMVTSEYAQGIGIGECSSYTLSVQFLNRKTYVQDLAFNRNLLVRLTNAFYITLQRALSSSNKSLDPNHAVLSNRRYSPVVSDLKCVLNVDGMPQKFCSILSSEQNFPLDVWIQALSISQCVDNQHWRFRDQSHVEIEDRGWIGAFNLSISFSNLYERILAWNDHDSELSYSTSLIDIAMFIVKGVNKWHTVYTMDEQFHATLDPISTSKLTPNSGGLRSRVVDHKCAPSALPVTDVSVRFGMSIVALPALSVPQICPISFHIPLHRFLGSCLKELCRGSNVAGDKRDISPYELINRVHEWSSVSTDEGFSQQVFFRQLLEFPIIVLSRAAQIRAELWTRNGKEMLDQVLNYVETPFCKGLRDADLIVVQFATLGYSSTNVDKERFSVGSSYLVNLLLNRFGVFKFLGFAEAPSLYPARYLEEVNAGLCTAERKHQDSTKNIIFPWTYSPSGGWLNPSGGKSIAFDLASALKLVEEFLHLLIVLITELPPPSINQKTLTERKQAQVVQARQRLRREVIHRLASGPKPFSELSEVHHVLSQRDNLALSEEGRLHNPDEAAEAALHTMLSDVAVELAATGFESKRWELKKEIWCEYDPCFYHSSERSHQSAAELRPGSDNTEDKYKNTSSYPFCPRPGAVHKSFARLRRDFTADAAVRSVIYRVAHVHCSNGNASEVSRTLHAQKCYQKEAMSETTLSRAVHLLTIGAYTWEEDLRSNYEPGTSWCKLGGGGEGSVFHTVDAYKSPSVKDWVESIFLSEPLEIMASDEYANEDCILVLLERLSSGKCSKFVVQDKSICLGAAWLCEFASRYSSEAAELLSSIKNNDVSNGKSLMSKETEFERRKREQKEKYDNMMKKFMMKNPSMFEEEDDEEASENNCIKLDSSAIKTPLTSSSRLIDVERNKDDHDSSESPDTHIYLRQQPVCMICNSNDSYQDLAFCAHAQGSLVLKGGGGPKNVINRNVGIHIGLCGHAMHYSCYNSYLKSVVSRDISYERNENAKKGEYRCPCCQRLSNCLVPFIDVDCSWLDHTLSSKSSSEDDGTFHMEIDGFPEEESRKEHGLHRFLLYSKWTSEVDWGLKCCLKEATMSKLESKRKRSSRIRKGLSLLLKRSTRKRTKSSDHVDLNQEFSNSDILGMSEIFHHYMNRICDVAEEIDKQRLGNSYQKLDKRRLLIGHQLSITPPRKYFAGRLGDEGRNSAAIDDDANYEKHRSESEREEFVMDLLSLIQAFAYSCCAEAAEVRRHSNDKESGIDQQYGSSGVSLDGLCITMPEVLLEPSEQCFHGKLGKLRNVALANMALCSPVSTEIFNLIFLDPLLKPDGRRSLVGPLLHGHILSLTTASLLACCGHRLSDDRKHEVIDHVDDSWLSEECLEIVKLGFLARILQSLLGILQVSWETAELSAVLNNCSDADSVSWEYFCVKLLRITLNSSTDSNDSDPKGTIPNPTLSTNQKTIIQKACENALRAGEIFLADAFLLVQLMIPNIFSYQKSNSFKKESNLEVLLDIFKFEKFEEILGSVCVQKLVNSWYHDASKSKGLHYGFRCQDWPIYTKSAFFNSASVSFFNNDETLYNSPPQSKPLISSTISKSPCAYSPLKAGYWHDRATFSPKNLSHKCVPLLGFNYNTPEDNCPRIDSLPLSYTDLFATLTFLSPESDQIGLCLVCGEVLDAGGKGMCTSHALKCGGGCGIFFLLQECSVIILNGAVATYLASPYVDSHGETPQIRGRPLNLDMGRYKILQSMWMGHSTREKVTTGRSRCRRLIDSGYY